MRKIGIVTINDDTNYGNRLQCYAVQAILNDIGYRTENIIVKFSKKNSLFNYVKSFIKFLLNYKNERIKVRNAMAKKKAFCAFNTNIVYAIDKIIDGIVPYGLGERYDFFVVGSDQVWNPNFYSNLDPFMLSFAPSWKKISFSASFGISSIPPDKSQYFEDNLKQFKRISVREESGAKIVKKYTQNNPTVLVDPTLLLDIRKWEELMKNPFLDDYEQYAITYFLSSKCEAAKKMTSFLANEMDVYQMNDVSDVFVGGLGPSEFLFLFSHAKIILTDSFHACVFSFLFNKPFIVYDRNWDGGNMNSRLESFLKKFSLERKYANSGLYNDLWEHDYSDGFKQLEIERKKAIDFLREAIE